MRAPKPSIQSLHIPAPVGGLNTVAAGKAMPDGDCPLLYNMLSGEHGLRVRLGSKEWSGGSISGGFPADATLGRTFIGYHGSASSGLADRLFVATTSGIWDCTTPSSGGSAVQSITFVNQGGKAGFGIWHTFVTSGGHFLLYCDEENGYYIYTESTDSWAKATTSDVTGVDPAEFCFVTVWKSRVWFVQKNTKKAWYLAAGAITGAATALNLDRSAQFRSGGDLVGLWSWTLDGGIGIDDHLVAVSRGGDVAVYKGDDPAVATAFALRGVWNAGAFVAGRRIATRFGGDVLFLTRSGLRPLSQLVSGEDGLGTYPTAKIGNLFTRLAYERGDLDRWDVFIHPTENALIVNVPVPGNENTVQLAMSLWNRSWSFFRDLNMSAVCVWQNKVYFSISSGSNAGGVYYSDGFVDRQLVATPAVSDPIEWSVITPFTGNGHNVQVKGIRPNFLSQDGVPAWNANARYNYDLTELASVAEGAASGSSSWDVGLWDSATWQSELGNADYRSKGATGSGRDFAIALRGTSNGRTVLVGVDVFFQQGGLI